MRLDAGAGVDCTRALLGLLEAPARGSHGVNAGNTEGHVDHIHLAIGPPPMR